MIAAACIAAAALLGFRAIQAGSSSSSAAEQVAASERAWSEAFLKHDLQAISQLLADDYVGIDGRGVVSDKAAELEEAKPPSPRTAAPVLVSERLSDIRVRIYGDTAVLTAINTARFSSRQNESTVRYRRTTVWVRREGRWQCVSFHGSRILEPSGSGGA
jgi:ketosteroid isomerase-like protein